MSALARVFSLISSGPSAQNRTGPQLHGWRGRCRALTRTLRARELASRGGPPVRILIAEDDPTSRKLLVAVLKKAGHEVLETVDGNEAFEVLRKPDAPKLAILDWMMPGMDGLEVVRRIREIETSEPPYILMLTAKGEKSDIVAGLEGGADDYLAKPFDSGELRARIEVGGRLVEMQAALHRSQEMLAHRASHDALTGLLNRRAILERLDEELAHARRHQDTLIVGMCDIDHFKEVNDTYGHPTGDDMLCGVARSIREAVREYDAVGRMGGEEFLVIAPMKAGKSYKPLFLRLCQKVAESEFSTRSGALRITLSIGLARANPESTAVEVLAAADAALYRAKREGRNRVAGWNSGGE